MTEPIFRVTARSGVDNKPVLQQMGTGTGTGLYPLKHVWVWATSITTARRIQTLYRRSQEAQS